MTSARSDQMVVGDWMVGWLVMTRDGIAELEAGWGAVFDGWIDADVGMSEIVGRACDGKHKRASRGRLASALVRGCI